MFGKKVLLMVRTDIILAIETEWNKWYDTRHIPERLNKAPGFLSARRFTTINDSPKYMTLYDLDSMEALTTAAYLKIREREASFSSESFEAITPKLPNFSSRLFEQIYPEKGEYQIPDTEIIFVVGHDVPPDREKEFNAWYHTEHIPAMVDRVPGFVTARRFVAVKPQLPPRAYGWLLSPKFVTLYDLENEAVLQSDAFLRETDSPWSSWVRSWYTKQWRFLARRIFQGSAGKAKV